MEEYDVAIIGGGPAGAHAAWKAALLYRSAVVIDKGRKFSRIFWSPRVDNLPGRYGISGREIIASGYQSITEYEADIGRQFVTVHENSEATKIVEDGGFVVTAESKEGSFTVKARGIIFATGAADGQPQLREFRRRDIEAILPYANKGLADYCLLCDGHTVEGKDVAVLGCDPGSRGIAKSLQKNFGARTAIIPFCNLGDRREGPSNPKTGWAEVEEDLKKSGIPIHYGEIKEFTGIKDGKFGIVFADGTTKLFDKAWISMGWYKVENALPVMLGAAIDENGFVKTDGDGKICKADGEIMANAYAIGDLRSGSWKQIPIAWGQAEAAVIDLFVNNRAVRNDAANS